ncbi:MAG: hypothetical protein ACTSR6_05790 [Candidatus Heimdallarchaeota archaeon]
MDAETILFLNANKEVISIISIIVSFPIGFIGTFLIHQGTKLILRILLISPLLLILPKKRLKRIKDRIYMLKVPPEPTLDNWL